MELDIKTRCIHGNLDFSEEDKFRAVSYPIYLTSTFGHRSLEPDGDFSHDGVSTGFAYSRQSNPSRQRLEETVAVLEGADDCVAFSSGMAAISLCFELFKPGDHIVCSEDLYGGVVRLFREISRKNGLDIEFVDTSDPDRLRSAVKPETRAVYVETPTNPMMKITDLRACASLCKEKNILLIVDNTFLTPYFQNPLKLGADLVVHSGTKFLSGHNDVISGLLCTATPELSQRVRYLSTTVGNTLDPFNSWLMLRGIRTLAVRMEQQQKNAFQVARWLRVQPKIRDVYYIGLPEHPGYDINRSQATGFGSMISFRTDNERTARVLLSRLKLILFAESLGGTETLITHPIYQTHGEVPEEMRVHLGITETLLRLSVGLESADDLIADLARGLED